jgi:hypothetical protein
VADKKPFIGRSLKDNGYFVRNKVVARDVPLSELKKLPGFIRATSENIIFDSIKNTKNFINSKLAADAKKAALSSPAKGEARKFKTRKPNLFNRIIKLAEEGKTSVQKIGEDADVVKLNNGKKISYGVIQKVITDEKGKEFFDKVAETKQPFMGAIRKGALANLDNILEDYYKGLGTKELTKKYFPNSPEAKLRNSSTVLENVINENADPEKLKNRPDLQGKTGGGVSPAKIILSNPDAKAEFIKFSNDPKNKILDSMKEAATIARKYAPVEGLKITEYTSRSGFMDSGLRPLITKTVQLGSPGVDPELTKRLLKVQGIIARTSLPSTAIKVNTPIVVEMADQLEMTPKAFLQGVTKLKEIYKTGREGFKVNEKVKNAVSRFPDAGFNRTLFLSKGYSKKTVDTLDAVERAAKKITNVGTQLEHSMPKALIKDFKLPRSNYLKGERTSNFLNQFKAQFDNQIINAAKDFRDGKISYDQYKKIVANIVRTVAKRTGGYEQGYIDFKNGDPKQAFAVTSQESILSKQGPMGRKNTGVSKFLKNASHHNELFKQYRLDPTHPDFGTLRTEIKSKGTRMPFVAEPELENLYNVTKNLKTTEEFYDFYKTDTQESKLFRKALTNAAGKIAKGGRGLKILGGAAALPLFATALAAEEVKQPQVKQPTVSEPLKYDAAQGSIINVNNDQKADQNQILEYVKDNPLKVTAGTSLGFAAQEVPGAYKAARDLGRGRVRSAVGISGALRPVLTTFGTPLITGLYEGAIGAKRLDEGETMTDILTDPFGPALGVSLMEPLSKLSGVVRDAPKRTMLEGAKNYFNLSNVGQARPGITGQILRMGLSPRTIAGASRFLGLPGVALGLGLAGFDAYKDYQNQEGMIYNLFNKDG